VNFAERSANFMQFRINLGSNSVSFSLVLVLSSVFLSLGSLSWEICGNSWVSRFLLGFSWKLSALWFRNTFVLLEESFFIFAIHR